MYSRSTILSFATRLIAVAGILLFSTVAAPRSLASDSTGLSTPPPFSIPALLGIREVEFQGASMSFSVLHSRYDNQDLPSGSFINALIVPEASYRVNRTDVNIGGGLSLQYDLDAGRMIAGLSSSIMLTTRRMVQFAVFRKESIALSYQWLPGRAAKDGSGFGIAGPKDTDKTGALGIAASTEMSIGRAALTTVLSYATPTFDTALATSAHEFPMVKAGAAGLSSTVRWHQYTSVATMARGGITVDTTNGTITYMLGGGVYGSPLAALDYQAMAGAEAGVNGISPIFDLSLTYKDAFKPGSRLTLDIRQRADVLSASLSAEWVLN